MTKTIKSAVREHAQTVRVVSGAFVAIATGLSYNDYGIAELGLQTVLELVYERRRLAAAVAGHTAPVAVAEPVSA
jgi:hypothetical protein